MPKIEKEFAQSQAVQKYRRMPRRAKARCFLLHQNSSVRRASSTSVAVKKRDLADSDICRRLARSRWCVADERLAKQNLSESLSPSRVRWAPLALAVEPVRWNERIGLRADPVWYLLQLDPVVAQPRLALHLSAQQFVPGCEEALLPRKSGCKKSWRQEPAAL